MKISHLIVKILLAFSTIKFVLTSKCTEGNFEEIQSSTLKSFNVSPENELCIKYKLQSQKNLIALSFKIGNIYSGYVYIYKSQSDIIFEDDDYKNASLVYSIGENSFKEIDVNDFNDYVYIIIKDNHEYFFNDFLILYDSEVSYQPKNGEPINIKSFMSNNKYEFKYISNKSFEMFFNSKIPGHKKITTQIDDTINDPINDEYGVHETIQQKEEGETVYTVTVELLDDVEDEEFSIIFYETDFNKNNAEEFIVNEEIKKEYIFFNDTNNNGKIFYFYTNVTEYTNSGTVNLKLDYLTKRNKYIDIYSDIVVSETELTTENLAPYFDNITDKTNLPMDYDLYSDEYSKIYFHNSDENVYKYIIVIVKINTNKEYHPTKFFTISIGNETNNIQDLSNLEYFKTFSIETESKSYIPTYFKLTLDVNSKYILYAPYNEKLLFIKGDLLTSDNEINKNYLSDEKDIIKLSEINELTVRIFGYEIPKTTFYIEKVIDNDTIIIENDRQNEAINILMSEEDCESKKKKYILGTYDKETYTLEKDVFYGIGDSESEFNLYFKNTIELDSNSLFPSNEIYKKELEKVFILDTNLDFYTISCNKPGNFYLRPLRKKFDQTTHLIYQNSINTINKNSDVEILQLSSSIKKNNETLYLSILSKNGNEITITPDTKELFEEKKIKGNELFTQEINTGEFKMDQLAIKITSTEETTLEVIEVIHQNYTKYSIINNDEKNELTNNNFIKFINNTVPNLTVNIEGLENSEKVFYGIVKLSSNDTNYVPPAYKFNDEIQSKNISKNETLEIENKYYKEEDEQKIYQAFIFSILTANTDKKYNVSFYDNKNENDDNVSNGMILNVGIIIAGVCLVIIIFIVGSVLIYVKSKKNLNSENEDNNNVSDASKQKLIATSIEISSANVS